MSAPPVNKYELRVRLPFTDRVRLDRIAAANGLSTAALARLLLFRATRGDDLSAVDALAATMREVGE